MSYKKDYAFGKGNEEKVYKQIINKWGDREIKRTTEKYAPYDFYDEKYKYELKSRNCNHDTYGTTMIQTYKLGKYKLYLLFSYNDGLYYIKYKKSLFDTFEVKPFQRKGRDDTNDIKYNCVYIPIEHLKKI